MKDVSKTIDTILKGLATMNHNCTGLKIDMKDELTITAIIYNPMYFDRQLFENLTGIKKEKIHIPEKILKDEMGFVYNDKYIIIKP